MALLVKSSLATGSMPVSSVRRSHMPHRLRSTSLEPGMASASDCAPDSPIRLPQRLRRRRRLRCKTAPMAVAPRSPMPLCRRLSEVTEDSASAATSRSKHSVAYVCCGSRSSTSHSSLLPRSSDVSDDCTSPVASWSTAEPSNVRLASSLRDEKAMVQLARLRSTSLGKVEISPAMAEAPAGSRIFDERSTAATGHCSRRICEARWSASTAIRQLSLRSTLL